MGITALHWAASTGSLQCIRVLIENGHCFPNHMEYHPARLTPLDYAVMAQHQVALAEREALRDRTSANTFVP
jgi:ankyrin repeat protein